MRDIIKVLECDKMLLQLRKKYYEKEAVFAAANRFTSNCTILIEPVGEEYVGVYFEPLKESNIDLEKIAFDFCNEVLDQQVRLDLERKYGEIKKLIVQHAFSPLADLKKEINLK